jgi:hypothetical protein
LTFPIRLPILILFLIFGPDVEDDERWCEEHGYVYQDEEGWGVHKIVSGWKKEYKKKEKDLIISRLKEKSVKKTLNQQTFLYIVCWFFQLLLVYLL